MHPGTYTLLLTVARHTIGLVEVSSSDEELTLALKIDGQVVGHVSLRPWYLPKLAVSASDVAIAGGMRLYLAPLTGDTVTRFDLDDEIHAMYPFEHRWLLVCETSVAVFDPLERNESMPYLHDEIMLDSWWSEGRLVVEDLQGRQLTFEPRADGAVLESTSRAGDRVSPTPAG